MRAFLTITCCILSLFGARAATTNQITSFGVTFYFSNAVEYGTFAGGLWQGVVGPVTITNITPAWDGTNNGFQVNVPFSGDQAFSAYAGVGGFTNALLPSLPLTLTTNCCVVSAKAKTNDALPAVQAYGVLTVLTAAPPAGWGNTIRPSIAGTTNRPLYTIADIRTNRLPTLDRSVMTNYTTLATAATDFSKGAMVDFHAWDARRFRDSTSLYDYQPENGPLYMNSMFSLFFNDSFMTKSNALIHYLTIALDRMTLVHQGYQQPGTGHNPGHRTIAAFAAVLLDVTNVIAYMSTNVGFHEDEYLYYSPTAGQVLWGQTDSTESGYWNWIMSDSGSRSHRDPYGYIDGGDYRFKAGEYQIITSQFIKGAALAGRLMTNIQSCFPSNSWWVMNSYAERWVTNGGWMTPDPVAPYDDVPSNYGVTFGPDGMGSYIAGVGRTNSNYTADGGQYRSLFVADLWNNYADSGGGGGGGEGTPTIVTNNASGARVMGFRGLGMSVFPIPSVNTTADLWQTFEFTDPTVANLTANDNTSTGTWLTNDNTVLMSISTSGERALRGTINGSSDTGHTRGLRKSHTANDTGNVQFDLAGSATGTISAGTWWKFVGPTPGASKCILLFAYSGGTVAEVLMNTTTKTVGFSGGSNNGVALVTDTWYWITAKIVKNSTSYISVYDTTGTLVGTEVTGTAANQDTRFISLGRGLNETADNSILVYWDDLVLDWTDATYPLGL